MVMFGPNNYLVGKFLGPKIIMSLHVFFVWILGLNLGGEVGFKKIGTPKIVDKKKSSVNFFGKKNKIFGRNYCVKNCAQKIV